MSFIMTTIKMFREILNTNVIYDLFKFVINLNDWIFEWNEEK